MLSASGIIKNYGDLPILKGVDLQVKAGELVAIVGASGAGKSTLLHILGTLDRPDGGEIFLDGQALHQLKSSQLSAFRNQSIGFIFQFHHLLPEFTALENVCIPGFIANKAKKEVEKCAKELLAILNLSNRVDHKPSALSGGEQQRVAVARALMNAPKLLLADEPSGNLDSANAADLHRLFLTLKNELNQTSIIVTHNTELSSMADRTLVMKDGLMTV
ncbi:MAG: ABC transporter ATP-binding protein [Sphingobacteriaceae bacterium]